MKNSHVVGLAVIVVAIVLAVQEVRISQLRDQLAEAHATAASASVPPPAIAMTAAASPAAAGHDTSPTRPRERPAEVAQDSADDADAGDFGKTVRKMWENPAGKSMMNQGVKMAVAMLYGDFVDSLDLTKEEADYFRELLGAETAMQQELGMKMMAVGPEEREKLMEEMERRRKENEEAIKTFLNSDQDFERFEAYKDRLPERQQLDGLRTAMAGANHPLTPDTESQLVEAMHRARTASDANDLSGAGGMKLLSEGKILPAFEESWQKQQEALRNEVGGILNEEQRKAFFEYQAQMKEFQLMSIRMAEKMMSPKGDN